jgi:hypothetical protein
MPESNNGGDQSGGDSLPELGKMQTMAPIGSFSSRLRQEGGRVSRGGPGARVRRMEAAATSLARGREGGGGRDLRESEVFEGMRARGQEENISVECLRKSSSRLVHSGCSCLDLFNIRAECTGSIPSTCKHLEFGFLGLENANVQYQVIPLQRIHNF